jgi:hypothetical protein
MVTEEVFISAQQALLLFNSRGTDTEAFTQAQLSLSWTQMWTLFPSPSCSQVWPMTEFWSMGREQK